MKLKFLALFLILLMLLNACAKPNGEEAADAPDDPQSTIEDSGQDSPLEEPAETPEPKKHLIKAEWKNPAITDEQRKEFYEWAVGYRMDAVPEFKAGNTIEMEWMKYYCVYFINENDREYVSGGTNFSGPAVEKIANERFGMSYGLKEGDVVFIKAEGGRSEPMTELINYKEETVNGKTLATARFAEYYWNEYANYTYPYDNPNYPKHREEIFKGTVSDYDWYSITDISYYTEADGKTPAQFVSCMGYGYQSLEDGYQTLPDFAAV